VALRRYRDKRESISSTPCSQFASVFDAQLERAAYRYFSSNSMNSSRVVPVFLILRVSPASFQMKSPS
jgi:hypothetical protein